MAQCEPPAVLEQAERAAADVFQCAVRLVAGRGAGGVAALEARCEIGRVACAQVKAALPFAEGAQVGAAGGDVVDVLGRQRLGEQGAGFRLQLDGCAGAAVAPVMPFQADVAAAGSLVCRALEPLWLGKAGQQQRV